MSVALAPGDACAFATVDALGRPDERMDRGVGDVLAGEAWALQVWVHSPLNALRADGRLCLLKFTPKRVADEVHARVANVDVLPPEAYTTFEGDNAMPLLPEAPRVGEAGVPCDHEDEWRDEEQTGVTEHVAEASGDDRHAAALCCSQ